MAVTVESAVFMGKSYLNNCQSIVNTTDLKLKQMFDISTRLVSEQDEISGLEAIGWENHSWKYLSLIGDERIINLQRTKVYVFSDSVFTGRILFMSMFNDISCGTKDNEEECLANAKVVSGQWSFIGPGSEKKWYSTEENSPQGIWDHIAENMLLEFAESTCPIFRATTPLSRCLLKSKGHGKLSIHFTADYPTIDTVFRIIISATRSYGTIWLKGCCWNSQKVIVQFSAL